jgi:hypothetical protein
MTGILSNNLVRGGLALLAVIAVVYGIQTTGGDTDTETTASTETINTTTTVSETPTETTVTEGTTEGITTEETTDNSADVTTEE